MGSAPAAGQGERALWARPAFPRCFTAVSVPICRPLRLGPGGFARCLRRSLYGADLTVPTAGPRSVVRSSLRCGTRCACASASSCFCLRCRARCQGGRSSGRDSAGQSLAGLRGAMGRVDGCGHGRAGSCISHGAVGPLLLCSGRAGRSVGDTSCHVHLARPPCGTGLVPAFGVSAVTHRHSAPPAPSTSGSSSAGPFTKPFP